MSITDALKFCSWNDLETCSKETELDQCDHFIALATRHVIGLPPGDDLPVVYYNSLRSSYL